MAFRDRGGQQSDWDANTDMVPPIWDERVANPRNRRDRDDAFGELPAWSKTARSESTWTDDEPAIPAPRHAPVRQDRGEHQERKDRQTDSAPWPSLRDSLRGHAGSNSAPQRTSRLNEPISTGRARPSQYDVEPTAEEYAWHDESPRRTQASVEHRDEESRRPQRRTAPTRTQTQARRTVTEASARPSLDLTTRLGSLTAGQDIVLVGSAGLSIFSLLVMSALVSTKTNAVSPWFVTHINAAGAPDRWATADAIWRLPLMTGILTLASIAAAVYVGRRDPFASRFLMATTLLIHLLGWIGLVRILW